MGRGYSVLVWDGYRDGLNMINPRLLHDAKGNNWWPAALCDTDNEVQAMAIRDRQLPWQDRDHTAPDTWEGAPWGSFGFAHWKILL